MFILISFLKLNFFSPLYTFINKNMITKNCVVCSSPFSVPETNRGTEKIYCSTSCRSKAGNERMFKKLINQSSQPVLNEPTINPTNQFTRKESEVQAFNPPPIYSNDRSLGYIERNYEAKVEALEYKLRLEGALKELEALKSEILVLESELEALPPPENKSEKVVMGLIENVIPLVPVFLERFMGGDKKVG
jgi:hypothetical protein